ncbi:MAG: tryptophan-rich sensory protein [Candidatus Hydrogenedentes bacterium]|nr:tryptophan-rich sensory protein [Candidatus Hydrogenedentota bacterium]
MGIRAIKNVGAFVLAQALCFGAAGIGSAFTASSVGTWYREIAKPDWTPPSWVFGPVWTVLYALMGVAAFLVWRTGRWSETRGALLTFLAQLALNTAWSIIFFGARNPGFAFLEILLLWIAIVATMVLFWRRSKIASLLLAPYLAWSSFAAFLNFTIWQMN